MDIEKLKESFEFSHTSTTPLYMQLASFFKICIQSEVLKIDEQLPTEESISKAYGISRTTVRQTMDLLIKEGYLLRVRGKGSFVTPRKLNRSSIVCILLHPTLKLLVRFLLLKYWRLVL